MINVKIGEQPSSEIITCRSKFVHLKIVGKKAEYVLLHHDFVTGRNSAGGLRPRYSLCTSCHMKFQGLWRKKSVTWRNFRFLHICHVEKCQIFHLTDVEKSRMSPHGLLQFAFFCRKICFVAICCGEKNYKHQVWMGRTDIQPRSAF